MTGWISRLIDWIIFISAWLFFVLGAVYDSQYWFTGAFLLSMIWGFKESDKAKSLQMDLNIARAYLDESPRSKHHYPAPEEIPPTEDDGMLNL